ncbi:hypothetical protein SGRIM128S_05098 [Streptomyces griseomycini]
MADPAHHPARLRHLPIGGLESRVRSLGADEVEELPAYERSHADRVPATDKYLVDPAGAVALGADPPPATRVPYARAGRGRTGSPVSPATSPQPFSPPPHGTPDQRGKPKGDRTSAGRRRSPARGGEPMRRAVPEEKGPRRCAGPSRGRRTVTWADGRASRLRGRGLLRKAFPEHWSFLLGEIALYSFVVLLLTDIRLTMFFKPSMTEVVYDGSYEPLLGPAACRRPTARPWTSVSTCAGGLLIRQLHHWDALVFLSAIGVHLLRVFFTERSAGRARPTG